VEEIFLHARGVNVASCGPWKYSSFLEGGREKKKGGRVLLSPAFPQKEKLVVFCYAEGVERRLLTRTVAIMRGEEGALLTYPGEFYLELWYPHMELAAREEEKRKQITRRRFRSSPSGEPRSSPGAPRRKKLLPDEP